MATIDFGLIRKAPRLGARLGVTVGGCKVWVSTVIFAGQHFTRVDADECEPCFYEGEIETRDAAERYLNGVPCAA